MASNRANEVTIFNAARAIVAADERRAYLDEACGADAKFRERVEKLLAAYAEESQFLERPAAELQATLIVEPGEARAQSLQAGLAAAFREGEAVVVGYAGHSVLKTLDQAIDKVPRVALRDSGEEGAEPIARPTSAEMPQRDSTSRYRLDGEIARGGMGAILKGRDTDLGRDLAIKVLLEQHKDKPEVIQRFVEEAQIGGQLQHPGIAPVYELGQFADQRPFFSMKLVKGQTLSKLLAGREDPTEDRGRFLGIFEQVCQTMAYAHSRGVIHRDLKPANIMVGAFGEVQVMDWGLAKVLSAGGVADEKKAHDRQQGQSIIQTLRSQPGSDAPGTFGTLGSQTQMGSVMGTPAYMPPEQALGEIDNLDERADVFGLGAILCEILTGKPPYVADDGTRIFRLASRGKLEDCFQRLESCGADKELVELTKQCLELEPADRPRDAGALTESVTNYLESVETRLRQMELERAAQAARADAEAARAHAERQRAEAESLRAESESARAQEERKRRRTSLALAASVLLLVGVGSGGWLYLLYQEADRQTAEADAQRRHAREMDQQRQVAVEAQRTAERSRAKAERAERDARERAIAEAAAKALAKQESLRAEAEAAQARKSEQAARELAIKEAAAKTLAQQETRRAEAATEQARSQLNRSEWLLYASKLMLAQTDFEAGHGGLAAHYLDDCQMDLRGWEHRYLSTRINARQTLVGHASGLRSVAVSPDSKWIVTGSHDGTARVWDAETGKGVLTLNGHDDAVASVAFSSDSKHIATGSDDKTAMVWDAKTGQKLLSLEGHIGPVHCVAFNSDGERISIGGGHPYQPGEVTVWDARTGQELLALKVHKDRVRSLAFSPDGKRIVTGSANQAMVWDAATGREILTFRHGVFLGGIWSVAFSPDGTRIATSAEDGKTTVWDAETGRELRVFEGHAQGVTSVTFSPDGRRIATGSRDNTVKIWDAERGEEIQTIKGHADSVTGVAFNGDGKRIVTASSDGTAKVWDAERGQKAIAVKLAPIGAVHSAAFSPDSRRVVTAGEKYLRRAQDNHTANVWDAETGQELLALKGHTADVWSVAFSPDGRRIATGGKDKTVREWDAETGQQLRVLTGHTSPVAFSPDGSQLATGHDDNTLRLVDTETGQELLSLEGHTKQIRSVIFAPDGTRVVTASEDGTAKVWNAKTGRELLVLSNVDARGYSSHSMACSRDGKWIVTACLDRTARVWDAETGQELLTLKGHTDRITSVAFSPDGQRVVTGSFDKSAKLWELERGFEVFSLTGHKNEVTCVAFSPDGQRIVTGTANTDNTVRVWHADSTPNDNVWPLPDATERIRFHMERAALAERENQLFAAGFHLRRVLRDEPQNTTAQVQLDTIVHTIPFKIALEQQRFALAAKIWVDALAVNPKLGDDRRQQHSYNAACAATLAAGGQGQNELPLDDASNANLRIQALNWLKAELTVWEKLLESGPPEHRPFVVFTLKHWQTDPDLVGIRDTASLSKLPTAEQEAFTQLWADVETLLKKAVPPTNPSETM